MNSSQLHRHLRSRPHHYHVIESNVKEEKKYLKNEEEIIEAIKDYRSSLLPPEENEITGCCCMIGGTSDKFPTKQHFNCQCSSYASIATVTSSNSSPISKNLIEIKNRLRKKVSKKKEMAEIESREEKIAALNPNANSSKSNLNQADIDELVKYINGDNDRISKAKRNSRTSITASATAVSTPLNNTNDNNSVLSPTLTKKQRQRLKKRQQVN